MTHPIPVVPHLQYTESRSSGISSREFRYATRRYAPYPRSIIPMKLRASSNTSRAYIHILDDDSLLYLFALCRPVILHDSASILQGGEWGRERWWYKLIQVCRRWRYLILCSSAHLRLCLVCTRGTPVATMLAHSPPLPIIIDWHPDNYRRLKTRHLRTGDIEEIILALKQHDRVRRIRIEMPLDDLQKVTVALDGEFPVLECLYLRPTTKMVINLLALPKSLRAPHLRHLKLSDFASPIESPLLTTVVSLVTLSLNCINQTSYFHPNALLRQLSLMPQLETLEITFSVSVSRRNIATALFRPLFVTHAQLSNLSQFGFKGTSAYLEALLPQMSTPLLKKFRLVFYDQLQIRTLHLAPFLSAAENLRPSNVTLRFQEWESWVSMSVYPRVAASGYALCLQVWSGDLDRSVASATRIFNALHAVFSRVRHLTLECHTLFQPPDGVHRAQWRDLLMSFRNVKTLQMDFALVNELSRSLQSHERESPLQLLPELEELSYYALGDIDDAFTAFIDARRISGHPVTLVHR
ncbi:hypothetical protein BC827DRAFT_830422 [Russula dissimulans]|nr:hypothetical protein BC827DRAFT_830422 [Russula dissimulans]